jgi:hypothetical protein
MDLIALARSIQVELEGLTSSLEPLGEPDAGGAAWYFRLNDPDLSVFLSIEDNHEDLNLPTVSMAIPLGDVTGATREQLAEWLMVSGDLVDASLTLVSLEEGHESLMISRKTPAEGFDPATIPDHVSQLARQVSLLLGE